MAVLNISVEEVVKAKMGPYLDSLSEEKAKEKLDQYVSVANDTIQSTLNEAEALIASVQNTIKEITIQVPLTIAQIASLVTMVDPTAKAAQLTTIKQAVGNQKDQLERANSQVQSLNGILIALSVTNPIVETLVSGVQTAKNLLSTIPV